MARHKKRKAKRGQHAEATSPGAEAGHPATAFAPRARAGVPADSSSPIEMMRRFAGEMDRVFEGFGLGRGLRLPRFEVPWEPVEAAWMPAVEVAERGGNLVVRADLPGLTKDGVRLEVTEDALRIHGERREERKEKRKGAYRSERRYGSFYREIPLPQGIDPEQAKATFRNGVLEVTIPAPPRPAGGRRVPIDET